MSKSETVNVRFWPIAADHSSTSERPLSVWSRHS